ncbi:homocysteine biosynthesis protein [candidate division WOR-3 bacterium]|nr:homocysteine biosynthesis protein [candidate division WOR-3 bacterium]
MKKTVEEINKKIKKGKAVVCTAEEIMNIVRSEGVRTTMKTVDVVTTGTFGPMCSSGAFVNFGHFKPKMRITKAWLNDVEVFCGIAAVDAYIGATQLPEHDPANTPHPGSFEYGGGHVIEDLVSGKTIRFRASSYGTREYPRTQANGSFTIKEINDAFLFNPRNCYQNYNVAVNTSKEKIYTYLGILKPEFGNANYCSAGQLSPLLNDPDYRTIGIGTRIFLGGGIGYVVWQGTQHDPLVVRNQKSVPTEGAGTLAVIGDLKQMKPEWLRGTSITGYGVSLTVGIGIPIPLLDEDILRATCIHDQDIFAPVVDYAYDYPNMTGKVIAHIDYQALKSGMIKLKGKSIPTFPVSSYAKARDIARILKEWIVQGDFLLSDPVQALPTRETGVAVHPFQGKYT